MPTGLAILGAGIFATEAHLPAIAALGPSVALRAVYSRSERSASTFASAAQSALSLPAPPDVYFDAAPAAHTLAALLARADIAAVLLVLPITAQPAVIRQALAAGKHVLSEKPVAPDVAQGRALIAEYEAEYKPHGLIWRVAENFEAEPGFRAAAKAVRDGRIGAVATFAARVVAYVDEDSKYYKTPWRTVPDYQGGFLLDGGVHFAAALRGLVPSPLTGLSGFASLNKKILAPHDTLTATLTTESGAHGMFEVTFAAPHPSAGSGNGYTVTGSTGWLTVANAQADGHGVLRTTIRRVVKTKKGEDEVEVRVEEEVVDERTRGVEVEVASFVQAVNGQDDGLGLGEPRHALQDVAVIQAALNSNGALVDLQKLVREG